MCWRWRTVRAAWINPADRSDKAIAMRELLTTVEDDEGFESTLTPDGTGLLIAYKK